jgi:hypothetical protein
VIQRAAFQVALFISSTDETSDPQPSILADQFQ